MFRRIIQLLWFVLFVPGITRADPDTIQFQVATLEAVDLESVTITPLPLNASLQHGQLYLLTLIGLDNDGNDYSERVNKMVFDVTINHGEFLGASWYVNAVGGGDEVVDSDPSNEIPGTDEIGQVSLYSEHGVEFDREPSGVVSLFFRVNSTAPSCSRLHFNFDSRPLGSSTTENESRIEVEEVSYPINQGLGFTFESGLVSCSGSSGSGKSISGIQRGYALDQNRLE